MQAGGPQRDQRATGSERRGPSASHTSSTRRVCWQATWTSRGQAGGRHAGALCPSSGPTRMRYRFARRAAVSDAPAKRGRTGPANWRWRGHRCSVGTTSGHVHDLCRAVRDRTVEARECPNAGAAEPHQRVHTRRIKHRRPIIGLAARRGPSPKCLHDWGGLHGTAGDSRGLETGTWQRIDGGNPRKSFAITSYENGWNGFDSRRLHQLY